MRGNRRIAAGSYMVAAGFSAGLLMLQPAVAQNAGHRTGQYAVGAKALRHTQGRVAGIDPLEGTVTVRNADGEMVAFETSPDVADVGKLQPGDTVNIAYRNAVLNRAEKTASNGIRERIETEVIQPESDGQVNSTRNIEFVATILKIDRKNREVTLRGPTLTQEFDIAPTLSLNGLKAGDSVRALFISPVATSIELVRAASR